MDDYNPCTCIQNLNYDEQETEMVKIISGRVKVATKYSKIIIYSELRDSRVGFNNVCTYVKRGITYLCICGIRSLPYESKINLTCDFLSVITQIPCEIPGTVAFYIRGRGHKTDCEDVQVPSLKSMSYLSLYLKGYVSKDFEYLGQTGNLPEVLTFNRPSAYGQVIYCLPNHLVHIFPPMPTQYIASCTKPDQHLFSYVD